jgi:hypothetical protein
MHPPLFRKTHRLSDWAECVIELHCLHCRGGSVGYPVRLPIERKGDMTFENLLRRLRCKQCERLKPARPELVVSKSLLPPFQILVVLGLSQRAVAGASRSILLTAASLLLFPEHSSR